MPDALEIIGLTKTYPGGVKALRGVDLTVPRGQFIGLLGPNGAGKTTTIGIVTGLVNRTAGTVKVLGRDVVQDFRFTRRSIGLAAQELNFDWFFSLEDLMHLQAGYYGVRRKQAVEVTQRLLTDFGLWEKRGVKPRELSGGMKRRFQIARSLVHDPEILILDEPTAGVDVELRRMLWDLLTSMNKTGKTIILTTHYIEEAEKLCERVAIIDNGVIITDGTPAELMAGLQSDGLEIALEGWNAAAKAAMQEYDFSYSAGALKIRIAQPELRLADVVNRLSGTGVTLKDISICRASLEDVFLKLTGHTFDD